MPPIHLFVASLGHNPTMQVLAGRSGVHTLDFTRKCQIAFVRITPPSTAEWDSLWHPSITSTWYDQNGRGQCPPSLWGVAFGQPLPLPPTWFSFLICDMRRQT